MALIATNFLGQNMPAIAATEAQYGEMWAQDAGAMYGYAAASAAASQLSPFTPPPQTTSPSGLTARSAAVAQSRHRGRDTANDTVPAGLRAPRTRVAVLVDVGSCRHHKRACVGMESLCSWVK